jgi:fatty-acyl-CoA synthase
MRPPYSRILFDLACEQADRYGSAPAIITDGTETSYEQLAESVRRVAAAMQARGVRRGDRVGLVAENRREWIEVVFAASAVGAIACPFSTWSTRSELEFLLRDSQVKILFTSSRFGDSDYVADLTALIPEASSEAAWTSARFPQLEMLVVFGGDAPKGWVSYESFKSVDPLDEGAVPPGQRSVPGDDAFILYTSGSSSTPKAVRLSHHGTIENGFNIGERQGLGPKDRVLLAPPLFWSYGGANALPATLTHGAAIVLQPKFEPGEAIDLVERHRCTSIYTLPGMSSAIARHPKYAAGRLRTLRTGLTIGSPKEFTDAVGWLGAKELCNIYGATETFGNCCVTWHHWPLERRAQSQGYPLPGVTIRIVDEGTGAILGPGQVGLVEVAGYLTSGYTGASAKLNAESFTADGFYRIGDVGRLNEDGSFCYVGRRAEMIKKAGINVSPAEVEEALLKHPAVAQAAVVGAPDAEKGELVVAFVVPAQRGSIDIGDLMRHCRALVSKYKVPDHIEIYAELPLTNTGKLQRRQLKEAARLSVRREARV